MACFLMSTPSSPHPEHARNTVLEQAKFKGLGLGRVAPSSWSVFPQISARLAHFYN